MNVKLQCYVQGPSSLCHQESWDCRPGSELQSLAGTVPGGPVPSVSEKNPSPAPAAAGASAHLPGTLARLPVLSQLRTFHCLQLIVQQACLLCAFMLVPRKSV